MNKPLVATLLCVLCFSGSAEAFDRDTDRSKTPSSEGVKVEPLDVERLDVEDLEAGRPPTLRDDQRGRIFEFWFPDVRDDGPRPGRRVDDRQPPRERKVIRGRPQR
jgi:hypothetical protein